MQVTAQVTNNCCLLIIEIALTRKTIYQINNSQKKTKEKAYITKKQTKFIITKQHNSRKSDKYQNRSDTLYPKQKKYIQTKHERYKKKS